ncbi:MAG: hypothetical protein GX256_01280 [Fretibacterium sp.]|nr:hypothetical protein [Fretibacterium sp.]
MHLFLEGPSGVGKTSLLLGEMGELRREAGGFLTQRLTQNGKTRGFRLSSPRFSALSSLLMPSGASDVFIWRREASGKPSEWREEPFLKAERTLLRGHEGWRLVLLDEIGGCDLLVPVFRERILSLLKGEVPCLGVFKAPYNAIRTAHNLRLDPSFQEIYTNFRALLLADPRIELAEMTEENKPDVRHRVRCFIKEVLAQSAVP